ncbi:MAG: MBL fold metallo-hydrolase [Holosporaceae bacterium]|jgi:L-ascorbate metabolism protein UlaG (beta-lactamase superfamily)|nr:MBL fold metallo-hydrolase [Holosporaceae bacterium]
MKKEITVFVACAIVSIVCYFRLPMFGRLPSGQRLGRIEKSSNYRGDAFRNINEKPLLLKNPIIAVLKFLFGNNVGLKPPYPLPSVKTDLKNLNVNEDLLIWFGHSSYLIQLNGKRILVDPLFSEVSSPVLFFPKAFDGSNVYQVEDMPEIDYLIITHDHWDHLDYNTVLRLKSKVKKIICPLGVGEHFEYWGFNVSCLLEMDWNEEISLDQNLTIFCLPAQHFSGRGFFRNTSLWCSFLLKTKDFQCYIGGDSGYGTHYKEIGKRFGPIDLAILDSGQHNQNWRHVHMMTDEVVNALYDLNGKSLLPVHICKVRLANHQWDEPLNELSMMLDEKKLLTPMIGEKIHIKSSDNTTKKWWKTYHTWDSDNH